MKYFRHSIIKRKKRKFRWELLDDPSYSPDLAPSDFYLFPKLKKFRGGKRLENQDILKESVNEWLNGETVEFFDNDIQKLIPRHNKCLDINCDYVEK